MVNLKNYSVKDDFLHHKQEFYRTYEIIQKYLTLEGTLTLNLCSGTGLHTGFLVQNGAHVIGVDLLDYETLWGGNFKSGLLGIFQQNNEEFDGSKCQFIRMNAENLLFRDDLFDFIYCVNAFEHIHDPSNALLEIWRVLKPGGFAFIQFDPVYYCDTGSHMFDFVPEPWGHLMYSEATFIEKLIAGSCPAEMIQDFKSGLNKKSKNYFFKLFDIFTQGETQVFERLQFYTWSGPTHLSHLLHGNFRHLREKIPEEDLLFRGMSCLLKKL